MITDKCFSKIVSVGYFVPTQIVKTIDIEKRLRFKENLGLPHGILERLTGCHEHRQASSDVNASDLAVWASHQAFKRAHISTKEIDMLIFCACSQDITEPATANIVQEKLDVPNAQVLDVKNACNSFINGIDIADSMIRTGKAETVLVTTGEVLSKYVDFNIKTRAELELRAAGLTLGDGGGAAIIQKNNDGNGLLASSFISDGTQWRLAVVKAGGTMFPRNPIEPSLTYFLSDSEKIINLAQEKIPPVILKVLKEVGWKPTDVDLVIPHQVTTKIIKDISKAVGIPYKRNIITVDRYGNTAAASIPISMGSAFDQGKLESGTKILLVGGASGFSVGVIALIW